MRLDAVKVRVFFLGPPPLSFKDDAREPIDRRWATGCAAAVGEPTEDDGLGVPSPFLDATFGGCGNDPIAALFFKLGLGCDVGVAVLEPVFVPGASGRGDVGSLLGAAIEGDRLGIAETERLVVSGAGSRELRDTGLEEAGDVELAISARRVFATGREGSALVGGPTEGRAGRGSVVETTVAAIVKVCEEAELGGDGGRNAVSAGLD